MLLARGGPQTCLRRSSPARRRCRGPRLRRGGSGSRPGSTAATASPPSRARRGSRRARPATPARRPRRGAGTRSPGRRSGQAVVADRLGARGGAAAPRRVRLLAQLEAAGLDTEVRVDLIQPSLVASAGRTGTFGNGDEVVAGDLVSTFVRGMPGSQLTRRGGQRDRPRRRGGHRREHGTPAALCPGGSQQGKLPAAGRVLSERPASHSSPILTEAIATLEREAATVPGLRNSGSTSVIRRLVSGGGCG